MVLKKNILNDLKKYNKELEKHIPGLDFDSLKNNLNDSNYSESKDDYFPILAASMSDMRVEMNLLRRNIMSDVEGLVMKSIAEQQNTFLNQTNKFYSNMISDLKSNFSSYISEMNDELIGLKNEMNKISAKNLEFDSKLGIFNTNILEFKELANKFDADLKLNSLNPVKEKLIEIENKFDDFNSSSKVLSDSVLALNSKVDVIFDNVNLLSVSQADFDSKISSEIDNLKLIDLDKIDKIIKLNNQNLNYEEKFGQKLLDIEKNLKQNQKVSKILNISKVNSKSKLSENINKLKLKPINSKNKLINSKTSKILDIDSKLLKLDSLR